MVPAGTESRSRCVVSAGRGFAVVLQVHRRPVSRGRIGSAIRSGGFTGRAHVQSFYERFHPGDFIGDALQHPVRAGWRGPVLPEAILGEPVQDADRPAQLQARLTQLPGQVSRRPARRGLGRAAGMQPFAQSRQRHAAAPVVPVREHAQARHHLLKPAARAQAGFPGELGSLAHRPQDRPRHGECRGCQQDQHGARRGGAARGGPAPYRQAVS